MIDQMWTEKYVWLAKYVVEMDKLKVEMRRDKDNKSLVVLMLNRYLG